MLFNTAAAHCNGEKLRCVDLWYPRYCAARLERKNDKEVCGNRSWCSLGLSATKWECNVGLQSLLHLLKERLTKRVGGFPSGLKSSCGFTV